MAIPGCPAAVRSSTGRFKTDNCDSFTDGCEGEDGYGRPDRYRQRNGAATWMGQNILDAAVLAESKHYEAVS